MTTTTDAPPEVVVAWDTTHEHRWGCYWDHIECRWVCSLSAPPTGR